jgi:hypothetical protein
MKKALLILLIATFAINASAQDKPAGSKFHFGLKATPSLAWLHTDTKGLSTNGSKFGFNYGLITEFNFADHYAFSTGLDITYRGGKFKQTFPQDATGHAYSFEATNTLEYVEIPLTLKLKTTEIGYMTYFLQFGVAPAINIRARQDLKTTDQYQGGTPVSSDSSDIDIKKNINNFNLSMIIAGGIEYNLSGNTNLLAAITFNNGFLDVLDANDLKANSNYLGLMVGVLF